jgi:hypothetical protein
MINICARETSLGHVMMWSSIFVLIGVVFHEPPGKKQNMLLYFTIGQLPLTVVLAPVTP